MTILFVQPQHDLCLQDAAASLYDSFHLNFVTYISAEHMQQLAAGTLLRLLLISALTLLIVGYSSAVLYVQG